MAIGGYAEDRTNSIFDRYKIAFSFNVYFLNYRLIKRQKNE